MRIRRRLLTFSPVLLNLSIPFSFGFILLLQQPRPGEPEAEGPPSYGHLAIILFAFFQFSMSISPSALQFVFAAELFPTRYRGALLGISSSLAMLGAIGIRLLAVNAAYFKTHGSVMIFIHIGAVFFSLLPLWTLLTSVERASARVDGRQSHLRWNRLRVPCWLLRMWK